MLIGGMKTVAQMLCQHQQFQEDPETLGLLLEWLGDKGLPFVPKQQMVLCHRRVHGAIAHSQRSSE